MLLHGESGSGKSWLYKKSLEERNYYFKVANLANAAGDSDSINGVLRNIVEREGQATKLKTVKGKSVGARAGPLGGGAEWGNEYAVGQKDDFEKCLNFIRQSAGKKRRAALVFDNFELIFDDDKSMKQLGRIIMLVDDEHYSKYEVKIILVGVPSGLREYYQNVNNLKPVANRLHEIPEVSRLSVEECHDLVRRGFIDQLGHDDKHVEAILQYICKVTDRLPQRLHEYCLEVALLCEEKKVEPTIDILEQADTRWLASSLAENYTVVEAAMNEKDTRIGRRNQTLFALGLIESDEFKSSELESVVRQEFPATTEATKLNMAQILSGLANRDKPIIKRSPKGDSYQFVDPKYRMCLRAMLRKDQETESVIKRSIGSLI